MTNSAPPVVLTIAGTDPSGGAGVQADIKTISANGCYATSVISALVSQNTQGVLAIAAVSHAFIDSQLKAIFEDFDVRALKIGMLYDQGSIDSVVNAIMLYKPKNIVLDPVMVAHSGCELQPKELVQYVENKLFSHVDLITPNVLEAEIISGISIQNTEHMLMAAEKISHLFGVNVLLKGGHLALLDSPDILYNQLENQSTLYKTKKVKTNNLHGTGCALSSAIACYLARSHSLEDAVYFAKVYLTKAIIAWQDVKMGLGAGPINHLFMLDESCSQPEKINNVHVQRQSCCI